MELGRLGRETAQRLEKTAVTLCSLMLSSAGVLDQAHLCIVFRASVGRKRGVISGLRGCQLHAERVPPS